jgi:hypothetical protein
MKILFFFLFFWVIFALLDPDPDPAAQINADPDTDPDPKPCISQSLGSDYDLLLFYFFLRPELFLRIRVKGLWTWFKDAEKFVKCGHIIVRLKILENFAVFEDQNLFTLFYYRYSDI